MLGPPAATFINNFSLGKLLWLSALQPGHQEKLTKSGVDWQKQVAFKLYAEAEKDNNSKFDPTKVPLNVKPFGSKLIQCKFGSKCTNTNCSFGHSEREKAKPKREKATTPQSSPSVPRKTNQPPECKFGINCLKKDSCTFYHPPFQFTANKKPNPVGGGTKCTRKDCIFSHPINSSPHLLSYTLFFFSFFRFFFFVFFIISLDGMYFNYLLMYSMIIYY
jgi:hypothetical protein